MIGILSFPGSNCETETQNALEKVGFDAKIFRWNEKNEVLEKLDGFVLSGGFSFEDRGRSGLIASRLPIIDFLREESRKGKPIIGICNGAQILVESGLVSDTLGPVLALSENKRILENGKIAGTGFYHSWAYLKNNKNIKTLFNDFDEIFKIPLAHAEGRFIFGENSAKKVDIIFQYSGENGEISNFYPRNPNGSFENIAGISNKRGNVLAIMPHPERVSDGFKVFESLKKNLDKKNILEKDFEKGENMKFFEKKSFDLEIFIKLKIDDNEKISLQKSGKIKSLEKYRFIGMNFKDNFIPKKIKDFLEIGELHNEKKEKVFLKKNGTFEGENISNTGFFVKNTEDLIALNIGEKLKKQGIEFKNVETGKYWCSDEQNIDFLLFGNPISNFIEK